RLCDRGLVEAPASLHFSIYSGDELLCAGIAESPVMPGDCVPAPCALDPDEPAVAQAEHGGARLRARNIEPHRQIGQTVAALVLAGRGLAPERPPPPLPPRALLAPPEPA
ncbi:MAG TPA: hypothetical protein VM686_11505, partial [Polyangiaceae bacterium]|nr:hypothetical protein [Polyangiaceae bacterium]